MAERSEFLKGLYGHYSQKNDKAPPVKRQETGVPKVRTAPQQPPPFKPQEHKRSAFTESLFEYQDQMNKEMERINKEAEKAEQDIIKQQQREGGAGLGTGVQPGTPEMAQEGLSPETGTITPPTIETQPPGTVYPVQQTLQETIIPQDLQAQMGFMSQTSPYAETTAGAAKGVQEFLESPAGQLVVGPGTQRMLEVIPGGRYLKEEEQRAFSRVPIGAPEDIPLLKWLRYLGPGGTQAIEKEFFAEGKPREETKVSKLAYEARLAAEWIAFPHALRGTRLAIAAHAPKLNKLLFEFPLEKIAKDSKLLKQVSNFIGQVRTKIGRGKTPEQKAVTRELKDFQDNLGKTVPRTAKAKVEMVEGRKTKLAPPEKPVVKPPVVEKVKEPAPPKPLVPEVKPPVPVERVPKPAPETIAKELDIQYDGPLVKEHPEGVHQFTITKGENKGVHAYVKPEEMTLKKVRSELEVSTKKHREALKVVPPEVPKPPTEAGMKAEVESAGAIWGAVGEGGKVDVTPWPATKSHPEGLRNFNSPYTKSTLALSPSKITVEGVKAKMLANYKETKKAGGELIKKVWPEGEAYIKGPTTTDTTLEIGGLQKVYETVLRTLKGTGKNKEIPKYARSINLTKQAIPDELKQFQVEVGKLAPKKYQSWDTTQKLTDEILKEYYKGNIGQITRTLTKAKKGAGLNTQEMLACRQLNVNAISRLKEIAETAKPEKFNEEFLQYVDDIFTTTSNASSEVGRALNIHKKSVGINRMANAFTKLKRELRPRELKEFQELNFENPLEVKRFVDRLGDPKLKDYLYEFWYNSILSGPPTHLINVISNTGWGMYQVPHRSLVGGIDKIITMFTGKQRQVYAQEIVPMLAGFKTGFLKGARGAYEMMRTGRITEFETKWARDIGHNILQAFERSPNTGLRKIAPFVSAPTRALRAMDVWANSIAYDAQLRALALRAGKQQKLTGKTLAEFQNNILSNPTKEMLQEAARFGKSATFMDDPGKIVSWIIQGRNRIPLSRVIVPFVNTIANLTLRGVEMTPGLGLLTVRGKVPAEIIAKQIEGTIIGLYTLYKADIGDITGAAPKNKAEREAFYREGKLAWSVRTGDKWYQYRRVEPFNTVIASAAIAYNKIKNAKDDETATEIFGKFVDGIIENLIDSSYLQGIANVADRYGRRRGMLQRTVAGAVPFSSFWRSILRAYEVTTTGETKLRESKDLLGAFAQVIPTSVLSLAIPDVKKKVPPRQDVWGKDVLIPGGVVRQFLPYKAAKATKDPVEIELSKLNVALKEKGEDTFFLGMPQKEIAGNKLTDEQYREYIRLRGKEARKRFESIVSSKGWSKIPVHVKKNILSRYWKSSGNVAILRMKRKYPELAKPSRFKKAQ